MIRLRVREVANAEGIQNALELSQKSGVPYASCHRLWNSQVKMIGMETIERLCTLLHVFPGQLFDFEPEEKRLPEEPKKQNNKKS